MLVTIADLIDHYLTTNRAYRRFSRSTYMTLERLRKELGHIRLDQFDYNKIRDYHRLRFKRDQVAPSTVMQDFATLRAVVNDQHRAFDSTRLVTDIKDAGATLRKDNVISATRQRSRRVSPYEVKAISEWADRHNHKNAIPISIIIPFAIGSCMRLGEICRLTWIDQLAPDRIIIRDRKDPREKWGNDQEIPLIPEAQRALALIRPLTGRDPRCFPYDPMALGNRFRRGVKACGFTDLRFHDLRHEGISRLFEAGLQIQHVQKVSGHKSWKNLARYTHMTTDNVLKEYAQRADWRNRT